VTLDVESARLTGSPAALGDAADDAARAAARLADARTQLLRVRAALDGQRSAAVDRACERATTLADAARASGGVLDATAAILRRHAGTLADACATADRAIADRVAALARERRWQAEADEARRSTWNITVLGTPTPGTAHVGALAAVPGAEHAHWRLAAAEAELAAARADVVAAEARWRAARDAKAAGSRLAAAALASLADVRAVRVASAAGVGAGGLQASGAAARQVAALLPRAAAGDDASRHALREDVRRALVAHADDPAFWAVFWDTATPAQLYAVVVVRPASQLGPVVGEIGRASGGDVDGELARALGTGLRLWTETATPAEQHELGRRVVADVAETAGSPLAPLGGPEAAAALLPASLPASVHAGAADALDAWWDAHAFGDRSITAMAPLVVAVAGGLAAHRTLAFDRLAPADEGPASRSAACWLGTAPRDGYPDGGRAVARVFRTAVDVGSTSADPADQARAALLVSHATRRLPVGLLASPGLADDAARDVALAYEPYLPSMGDATVTQGDTADPRASAPAPGVDEDAVLVRDTDVPVTVQPELDAFALRDVIEATSRTPAAADAWLGAADRYTDSMIDLAVDRAPDGRTGARGPFVDEVLSDVGAVAGSIQAPTITEARHQVQTREALLSLTGMGVGMTKITGSAVESVATMAGSTSLSFVSTDGPLTAATTQVRATQDELYAQYASRMHDAFVAADVAHGVPEDEARARYGSIDPSDTGNRSENDFEETYDFMSQADDQEGGA